MKKPDFNQYTIKQLVERWKEAKITEENILQYGAEGKIKIYVNWPNIKTGSFKCSIPKNELIELPPVEIQKLNRSQKIDLYPYISKIAKSCKFEYSEEYVEGAITGAEKKSLGKIYCNQNDLVIRHEEMEQFEEQLTKERIPPYLNKDHTYYCKELAMAVEAWLSIFEKKEIPPDSKSCKDAVITFIESKSQDWALDRKKKIASIVNYALPYKATWEKFKKDNK